MSEQQYSNLPAKTKQHSWLMAFVITALLLMLSLGFGLWAYLGLADYKNNTQAKIDAATKVAVQEESSRKDNEFAEREKLPGKTFNGPGAYGSISFLYPKSWSAYVIEKDRSRIQIDGYFHIGVIPDIAGVTSMALRLQVVDLPYSQTMKEFESGVRSGKVKVNPYEAKNVEGTTGAEVIGEISTNKKVTMVVLPLRDKTLKIWTESDVFADDFNNMVLENLDFSP